MIETQASGLFTDAESSGAGKFALAGNRAPPYHVFSRGKLLSLSLAFTILLLRLSVFLLAIFPFRAAATTIPLYNFIFHQRISTSSLGKT
jgi:hypothetical protein